ncbi:MAG: (2Fe-2S)-binding protein [Thiovulaceae bacterium]|nr:(2Fe-2S)-binding protein [Sulfurimonadaceae bacterium]
MIKKEREVCVCNDVTAAEVIKLIKENNIHSMKELLDQNICPVGDKCESCHEDGYDNDGFSLAMILSLVEQKKI